MEFTVIIPARLSSTRLENKPLIDIAGLPMIVRTAKQAELSNAKNIVIATDSTKIAHVVQEHGFKCVLTDANHQSGTDRIAQAAKILELNHNHLVVNVQGDEPLISPDIINTVTNSLNNNTNAVMATCANPITKDKDFFNPNIVKVVCDQKSMALYFSRAPIPWARDHLSNAENTLAPALPALHHIGIYAYRNSFLQNFSKLPIGSLEKIESLEQLRVLENGYKIAVNIYDKPVNAGVDTEEDLIRVRNFFQN